VVGPALLTDRGLGLGGEVLAARRSGPVGGEDAGDVGQGQQLGVQRAVQLARHGLWRSFSRRRLGRQQVGATHVADEEGVARKDSIGHLVAAVLVDHEAH
jgi:hypothetical protein